MPHQKHFSTSLVAGWLGGSPVLCELTLTRIGSLSMKLPDSLWIHLLDNLAAHLPTIPMLEVVVSLQKGPLDEPEKSSNN